MASILSLLSPAQLLQLAARVALTEKVPFSATGEIVAGDNIGEAYLYDAFATFVTAGVVSGDIVQVTAGTAPLGYYSVAGRYYDPRVDAAIAPAFETTVVLNGFPTVSDPITYRVLAPTPILEELAQLTESRSQLDNVASPAAQELDDLFTVMHDKFNLVCDLVADEHRWLNGVDRSRVTALLINTSAAVTTDTVLFPDGYFELDPNRATVFPLFPPIDPFTITQSDDEREGVDEEEAAGAFLGPTDPLTVGYTDALDKEEAALLLQRTALLALQTEIADNDATSESGDLNTYYTAMSAGVTAALSDTQDRLDDIDDIRTADRARIYVAGLNNSTYAAVRADIDARAAALEASPYTEFLDFRYTYLDLLVNRAYGTRVTLQANAQQVTADSERAATLLDELATGRELLQLP